jgi:hypothetical protein
MQTVNDRDRWVTHGIIECWICGDPKDHYGQRHALAWNEDVTRYTIIAMLDGRDFRPAMT